MSTSITDPTEVVLRDSRRVTIRASVAVADDSQHQGLGKLLLRRLIEHARIHGVRRLTSMDAASNHAMRRLARDVGFKRATRSRRRPSSDLFVGAVAGRYIPLSPAPRIWLKICLSSTNQSF